MSAANYSVRYTNNKNPGEATVTVRFRGSLYSGTLTKTFTIKPTPTAISKLTARKHSFTVQYAKKTEQVSGYEIQWSWLSKFNLFNRYKVNSYKGTQLTVVGLEANKTYYVRVRTYKVVDGKYYYSDWSAVKNVKTNKN